MRDAKNTNQTASCTKQELCSYIVLSGHSKTCNECGEKPNPANECCVFYVYWFISHWPDRGTFRKQQQMTSFHNPSPLFWQRLRALLLIFILFGVKSLSGQTVVNIELKGEIDEGSYQYFAREFKRAKQEGVSAVIVEINTYGGRLDYADSISTLLLDAPFTTAAYVNKNAASAGALISLSCDSIYMRQDARMGAATVVDGQTGKKLDEKYQSYMRKLMASAAAANGRNPAIAEQMVGEPSTDTAPGEVLTLTTAEALEKGYCEAEVTGTREIVRRLGLTSGEVEQVSPTETDAFISFLLNPTVSAILIFLLLAGIFFELKAPGLGFPSVVALVAGGLLFFPHYVDGSTEIWEIGIFGAGVVFLALEIFVVPGFGVTGVLGILLSVAGITMGLVENDGTDFSNVSTGEVVSLASTVVVAFVVGIIAVLWLGKYLISSKKGHPIVDETMFDQASGYTTRDESLSDLIGQEGVVDTDMRPYGFVRFGERRVQASAESRYLKEGTPVVAQKLDGNLVMVAEKEG